MDALGEQTPAQVPLVRAATGGLRRSRGKEPADRSPPPPPPHLSRQGLSPNAVTYTAYIQSFGRDATAALHTVPGLVRRLRAEGPRPNAFVYSAAIKVLSRCVRGCQQQTPLASAPPAGGSGGGPRSVWPPVRPSTHPSAWPPFLTNQGAACGGGSVPPLPGRPARGPGAPDRQRGPPEGAGWNRSPVSEIGAPGGRRGRVWRDGAGLRVRRSLRQVRVAAGGRRGGWAAQDALLGQLCPGGPGDRGTDRRGKTCLGAVNQAPPRFIWVVLSVSLMRRSPAGSSRLGIRNGGACFDLQAEALVYPGPGAPQPDQTTLEYLIRVYGKL